MTNAANGGETPAKPPQDQPAARQAGGPGEAHVHLTGIILISAYILLLSVLSAYVLIKVWPHHITAATGVASQSAAGQNSTAAGKTADQQASGSSNEESSANTNEKPDWIVFFWGTGYWVWYEVRLLLIVITTGCLGGLLHAIRSLYWYVGHRELRLSWVLMYVLLPFSASLLAIAFYLVIRGGFFPQAKAEQTSPIAFSALALLVGLFSFQAGIKLKQIFETVFTSSPPGANSVPQTPPAPAPKISTISPDKGSINGDTSVAIVGVNFSQGVSAKFGDAAAKSVTFINSTRIDATTPAHAAGTVDVVVANKDGQSATLPQGYTYAA